MLEHDPRWLMQRKRELMSQSQALCEQSGRIINESRHLEARFGIPHSKSDKGHKPGSDITRNR